MTDKLIPDPPKHELKVVAPSGPWGGPTYSYRGARIECNKPGAVCGLFMEGHPLSGISFGDMGTVTPHVDRWVDERRLAPYLRVTGERAKLLEQG